MEVFKLLSTKCTYWVAANAVYLNFLPTWQMKLRFSFGAKQQHEIMVPPIQAWTAWQRRSGLTCLTGRGDLSELEKVLEMQQTGGAVYWFGFSYTEKVPAIFIVEEGIQIAKCLSSFMLLGFFFNQKGKKKSSKYIKGNKIYTNTKFIFFLIYFKVIVSIIGRFLCDSLISFHFHFVTDDIQFSCIHFFSIWPT